ncbi:VWA domain-containing protein [Tenacibaculum sp. 190130A14a]|uniref:VWA domain-containing protein n=1 Tax=Tenacibaculum polynesiense TaxID=3137857 RepID=UPI0032B2523A
MKTLSVFLLLLLLLNPKITVSSIVNQKPILAILSDNSSSIPFFKENENLEKFVANIVEDDELKNKFDIKKYGFGNGLLANDSLNFTEKQTNISKSLKEVNELLKGSLGGVLLLSDGNQTIGNDYEFTNSKLSVYPIAFGDTTSYQDVQISQLNVNRYSYLKNKFPVEAFIHYKGKKEVSVRYSIATKGSNVFSQNIKLSAKNNTKTVVANLESDEVGTHFYTASVSQIEGEKNTKNNRKNFSIEVIDEQQKGAILASSLHPDLGAIKRALESNKKRSVDVFVRDFSKIKNTDYQFFILFQPNNYFNDFLSGLKSNFLIITGENTDWNYLNSRELGFQKNAISQSENYEAFYNESFLTFQQKNIGFNQFPPLKDKFGKLSLNQEAQVLLFQKITGVKSNEPLLATFEKANSKYATLFGEGIWKWRANSFLRNDSFEEFDSFLGSIIQYISSNKKRNRLEVTYKKLYPANTSIQISAFYLDKNYLFDSRASLWLSLTSKETGEERRFPMSLKSNSYVAILEDVLPGEYDFKVSVDSQSINRRGTFRVTDYEVEEQFTNANVNKLANLASNTQGRLFYKTEFENLKAALINNKNYYTIQSSNETERNLIDWKWILFVAVLLLTLEWFIRKYYGKI